MNLHGALCEDFDTERNSVPGFQWSRLPTSVSPTDPLFAFGDPDDDVLGYTQDSGDAPLGTSGQQRLLDMQFDDFTEGTCSQPVAEENDWHLHSPIEGPGESYDPTETSGIGAPDGGKAHSGLRSMHMGRHLDSATTLGDTTRFRQVSAFVLDPPVNLGPASTLEFWHLVQFPEFRTFSGFVEPALGGAQVQISLRAMDGSFEKWQRLTPAFNGYNESIQREFNVCEFDPGDDQFTHAICPEDETLCLAVWSDIGDIIGGDATCQVDSDGNDPRHLDCGAISSCAGGPGCTENGSIGTGVWVRSALDLSPFAGRQARLRWIGMMGGGWAFGTSRSFLEPEPGEDPLELFGPDADDGWYIDDIVLTDLRTGTPVLEGSGFWKQQCRDSPEEVEELFAGVADASEAFEECAPISCAVLDPARPRRLIRPKALRELMALWLNVATGRLPTTTSIELSTLTEATTVGEAIAAIEATVCDPQARRADLETAKDLAETLNAGAGKI